MPCKFQESCVCNASHEKSGKVGKEYGAALAACNLEYEVRREKGSDIDAACGQLRNRTTM